MGHNIDDRRSLQVPGGPLHPLHQHFHAQALPENATQQQATYDFVSWKTQCLLQQISGAQKKLQASQLFAHFSLMCLVGAWKDLSLSMDN